MAGRESFLIRVDPALLDALRRWAADELRSVNAQVEFVLRRALADAGRLPARKDEMAADDAPDAADVEVVEDKSDEKPTTTRKRRHST